MTILNQKQRTERYLKTNKEKNLVSVRVWAHADDRSEIIAYAKKLRELRKNNK